MKYQIEQKNDELNAVYDEAWKTNLSELAKTINDEKIEIGSEELETLLDSTLTIGSQTFALADLSKMYFSTQSETTGISEELRVNSEEFASATFYDLQGHKVTKEQMKKGVYIVNKKKVVIK